MLADLERCCHKWRRLDLKNRVKPLRAKTHIMKGLDAAQKATVLILKSSAKQWQVAAVIKSADGTAIVVNEMRIQRRISLC